MLVMGPHWYNIASIGNLILSIESVTFVEINVSMFHVQRIVYLSHVNLNLDCLDRLLYRVKVDMFY